jgi:hypothetical protein
VKQGVRDAPQRRLEATEAARSDHDLCRVAGLRGAYQRVDRWPRDDVGLDAGQVLESARELAGTLLVLGPARAGSRARRASPLARRTRTLR